MHKPLLPVAILLILSACQSEKAAPRRLQALTYSLEQANDREMAENANFGAHIRTRIGWLHNKPPRNLALAQLLARCDTIQVGAARLRERLRESRQLLRRAAPDQPLSPAQRAATTRLLEQLVAYQATLHILDKQVVLPRLVPPTLAGSAAALPADFYFRDATATEALAALAQLDATTLTSEGAALLAQSTMLACGGNIIFDKVGAWAIAESNTVAAGTEYRADLVLASALTIAGMTMSANGQPIAVMPEGIGQVRFIADPRLLGNRQAVTAYWNGLICVKSAYTQSGDTTYKVRVPYRIVRSK
jgi:hypothetical protein